MQIAKDPSTPVRFQISTFETVSGDNQVNEDYILAYTPGEDFIRTIPITTTASRAIAALWINFYSNKAQQLAQEASKNEEEVKLPSYLELYTATFDKGKAERMPKSRPYDHTIELKEDFVPRDCKVYALSQAEEKEMNEFIDENLRKGYI
jgi:hypothetical protein